MAAIEITESQRSAAKAAGWAYLATLAIVVAVNFGIHDRLAAGGRAEAARNILAHATLFRAGIVGDLVYCAGVVVQLTALYVILAPVGRGLALLAALWRFVWVLTWGVMTLHLAAALRLLGDPQAARALGAAGVQALAGLELSARFDDYYVGLLFGSLASTACAWLWLRSRHVPRALAAFGLIASAWCVLCTAWFLVSPHFSEVVNLWWFDTPMALFDLALSVWLLVRGLRPPAASLAVLRSGS